MKRQPPIDEPTYRAIRGIMAHARSQGLDGIEALNRAGLFLTPHRDREIRAEAMGYILERMSDLKPHEFLRRKHKQSLEQRTAGDLYVCILEWLDEVVSAAKKGTL